MISLTGSGSLPNTFLPLRASLHANTLTLTTGYQNPELQPDSGNIVYMQHILINDSGSIIDVTVSSYESAHFQKIDDVCETNQLFTNHILVIPYSVINTSDIGRYLMLPALAEFTEPGTSEKTEIFFDTLDEIDCLRDPFSTLK